MNTTEQVLIFSAAISLVSIAPLIFITFLLVKSHRQLIGEYKSLKEKIEDEERLAKEAQHTAHQTIMASALKAQEIVKNAQLFKDEIEATFKQNLTQASQEQSSAYRQAAQSVLQETIKEIQKLSTEFSNNAKISMVELSKEQANQIKRELIEYKKLKAIEIDSNIEKALKAASLKIIGRAISRSEHEEMVLKALEEAKKENGL